MTTMMQRATVLATTLWVGTAGCNSDVRQPWNAESTSALTPGGSTTDGNGDVGSDKLDLPGGTDTAGWGGDCPDGGGTGGEIDFSYIWIANSPQGTVSKIDTRTATEVGRYYTGPTDGDDDPSRTSVNLAGDAAVANRAGGLTKIAAIEARCFDRDGDGAIRTSTGPDDVLPFGEDECMRWHVSLPSPASPPGEERSQGPRPTAWDAGSGEGGCSTDDARLWNGWWSYAEGTAYFRRFDGETGATLDEVVVPDYHPGQDWSYGPYGGAVDGEGHFWVTGLYGPLLRIDAETLVVDIWPMPQGSSAYGMGVDADGHVWTAGVDGGALTHFDPDAETFDVYATGNGSLRGLMIDRNGHLWAAGNAPCSLVQFDVTTRSLINGAVPLPGCDTPVGVSIDVDGFVWSPDQWANVAFKVDPSTYTITTAAGLVQPYTYSDMTGAGLDLVVNPPVE